MRNNILEEDQEAVIKLLRQTDPILTQSTNVRLFEQEWSDWLGVEYSVFVNSGASANLITMAALRHHLGPGEIIVPALTWVSDIASVIQNGFKPIFVDIDLQTLGMDTDEVLGKIGPDTKGVFITHVLGYNAINEKLLAGLKSMEVPLIEDVCESHGATFRSQKLGTFGLMSNFSFYYAHHMSTIEGGMVSTDDPDLYQVLRMLRSHGMVRESTSQELRQSYYDNHPDLNRDFIFALPAYNVRSTEVNAVVGRSQLKRLDANNDIRKRNLQLFLNNLNPDKYYTDFIVDGSCNYALTLVLRQPNSTAMQRVMQTLQAHQVEFRLGTSGGGNQLRQPYLRAIEDMPKPEQFPKVDHIHYYGAYIGNYPGLDEDHIIRLCSILNDVPFGIE